MKGLLTRRSFIDRCAQSTAEMNDLETQSNQSKSFRTIDHDAKNEEDHHHGLFQFIGTNQIE